MLLPIILKKNYVDNFFDSVFNYPSNYRTSSRLMNTDVQELEDEYQVDIELAGYDKDDIKVELKDGNLIINAEKKEQKGEKAEDGRYIRKERYSGSCRRSFYVGKDLKQEDIKASFKNGVLRLILPKDKEVEAVEEKGYIPIDEL